MRTKNRRRLHTQTFDEYELEQYESKLSPLELATDRWLSSKPGTVEAVELSGKLLAEVLRRDPLPLASVIPSIGSR